MGGAAAIGIHNDLPPGKSGVPHRAAHHKASRGINVEFGVLINILYRNNGLNDGFHHRLPQLLERHVGVMLGGNDDGGTAEDLAVLAILHRYLALSVGPQPR